MPSGIEALAGLSGRPGALIRSTRNIPSAIRISTEEIGITDCTKFIDTQGRLTSESPTSTGMIEMPTQPSSAKNRITST